MSTEIANALARLYIARPDAKAVQVRSGAWNVHTDTGKADGARIPWSRADIMSHLAGEASFGHYLLSDDSKTKLFCFDIDLEKFDDTNPDRKFFYPVEDGNGFVVYSPREAWLDRANPARPYLKQKMKLIAHEFARGVTDLDLPCSVAYSGSKGIHVYAYTGLMDAGDAREGAKIVIDSLGHYKPTRGDNFYQDTCPRDQWEHGFPEFSIEVYPKQSSLSGKDLGNLIALPLGKNKKSSDPKFFVDMTSPMAQMVPVDPIHAMAGNPWKKVGE